MKVDYRGTTIAEGEPQLFIPEYPVRRRLDLPKVGKITGARMVDGKLILDAEFAVPDRQPSVKRQVFLFGNWANEPEGEGVCEPIIVNQQAGE